MTTILDLLKGSSNWNDIYTKLVNEKLSGKLFEEFCKYYYLCEPSVRTDYKNVWCFSDVPTNVRQKLNLGTKDHGIDLVLESHEGEYSAVQCKFRGDQSSNICWSKDKLANLFADGDKADYFIVFTNTSGLDNHSLNKKPDQLKLVTLGDLLLIDKSTIAAIKNYIETNKAPVYQKKKPRPYQSIAIDKVVNGFKANSRGQLILPCGAGKTMVSLWIKEQLKPKHTIVLFPSLALLRQTKNEWAANQESYTSYICVCSEMDIDKQADHIRTHTYEIGGRVSTNPEDIRKFLQSHDQTVIYSTYQSLKAISDAVKPINFKFDLAICDEAHKTAGSKLGSFGLIHQDANIPVDKRLYMTATPRIISDRMRSKNEEVLDYIADMSDPEVFGKEFHRMNFSEAIEQGILVDYKIIAIGVSDRELEESIKIRKFVSDGETIDEVANNYALDKFMNEHNSSHAITFHSSVNKADSFKNRHQDLFPEIDSFHVSGKQTTNDRNITMREFEHSKKSIVTNARCLTEGIDIPAIDTVYFCDPKNSKVDIVQAAGRALRRADHKGKTIGHIVVPIYHREKDKLDSVIEDSTFKNLISVVMSLSDHDERIMDEIKSIKLGKGERINGTNHISIDESLELIAFEGFEKQLSASLFSQVIDKIRVPWRSFEEAREFIRSLNLKSQSEFFNYIKKNNLPEDIPTSPSFSYKQKGWISWGDWLGTGSIAVRYREYRSFDEARAFVHKLGLKSRPNWVDYTQSGNKPYDIPTDPSKSYSSEQWKGWGDWLGAGRIAHQSKKYRSYEEAKTFVHTLGLKTLAEWDDYVKSGKKPDDIPSSLYGTYKNKGWISIGDWLGTGNVAPSNRKFRPFEQARSFSRDLSLKSGKEWKDYVKSGKKPYDIPTDPAKSYGSEKWKGWGDWLGTFSVACMNRKFRPYEEAKKYIHSLALKSKADWTEYAQSSSKPDDIPSNPSGSYKKKGWISWGDWLGTGAIANQCREYRSFEEARAFVHNLCLKSCSEWAEYTKKEGKPEDIPSKPDRSYKNKGWVSWGNWLGTGAIASFNRKYRSFEDARAFVHILGLKSQREWMEYSKSEEKPNDIPATPREVYKDSGWISVGDWLGTGKVANQNILYRLFNEAREHTHKLKLRNQKAWIEYCKSGNKPDNIPANPREVYKESGWISMGDWLGTGNIANRHKK